ncbi:hypothetical protein [Rhodopila sp.]|uniref:hypothetical protein n=1 Tax=Rhodopila sp. TaxID=2480087 RepID=UPI003D0CA902
MSQHPTLYQPSIFLERLVRFLIPYFLTITPDLNLARTEILETLISYGARTRAEMLNAVQIIAFGFSALDVLAEAKATEMSPTLRLRFRGCANGLNRSCQQNEKALARRLTCDIPNVAAAEAEPLNDVPDPAVEEAIQQASAKIETYRNRLSGARPATVPHAIAPSQQDANPRPWGSAIMQALAETQTPGSAALAP